MARVSGTALAGPPAAECTGKCKHCTLATARDRNERLVEQAESSARGKTCTRRLAAARRGGSGLSRQVASLGHRNCLAPSDRVDGLESGTVDLVRRLRALTKGGFCKR